VAVDEVIGYEELDGFPRPTVIGHAGRAVLGTIGTTRVCVLQGRAHVYEGHPPEVIARPIRALAEAGVEQVLLTNAAGSLVPRMGPGALMAITDHINFMGFNPLTGPFFVPMGDAYDDELLGRVTASAVAQGVDLFEGVYLAVRGPNFETPAEIRAFRTLGADAVGMSTVPEVIVARHAGLRVAAISVITNYAEGLTDDSPTHEQTLRDAKRATGDLAMVVQAFCTRDARP
jgi:inosine/guanosine/xanthosine phosphorylase family protein